MTSQRRKVYVVGVGMTNVCEIAALSIVISLVWKFWASCYVS